MHGAHSHGMTGHNVSGKYKTSQGYDIYILYPAPLPNPATHDVASQQTARARASVSALGMGSAINMSFFIVTNGLLPDAPPKPNTLI